MSESRIYDVILVTDLKREVFSFLDIQALLPLRAVNSRFHDSIEYDDIVWNYFSRKYFGVSIHDETFRLEMKKVGIEDDVEQEENISFRERFVSLTKDCTCTEYFLETPIPKDLFQREKVQKEKAKVGVLSRKYPFKTNLISPSEFVRKKEFGSDEQDSIPSSSLIFEHIVRSPLSEEKLKILQAVCAYFCELVFCSTREEDSLAEEIKKLMELEFGIGSMTFLDPQEIKLLEEKFEAKTYFKIMFGFMNYTKEKSKKYDWSSLEKVLSSEKVEELIKNHRKNKHSVIHSVKLDYQPQRNRIYSYWNFSKFKDPVAKLYKKASGRISLILPWFPIFQSMKRIFSFPSRLLKKKSKELKLTEEKRKKSGKVRKKGKMEFNMKWRTFLRNLEFRMLGDVGQYVQYDYTHQWFTSACFYYAREYFGEVESAIIRNEGNSQFVINFNDSFHIFDHALLVEGCYPSSVVSKTVEYLQKERKEEIKLEEEWEKELEELMKKEKDNQT